MLNPNNYVTYAYISEETKQFYYIGKGRPSRPYVKQNRSVIVPSCRSRILILASNLDEKTAYEYEKKFINFYGRKDIKTGWCVLENRTNGGSGFSGIRHSLEWRKRKSEMSRGANNRNYNPMNWFHPICGEINCKTTCELARMFPEQNLVIDHLRKVSYKQKRKYRGWIISEHVKEWEIRDPDGRLSNPTPGCNGPNWVKRVNWFHSVCGEVYGKTSGELSRMFPEQKLDVYSLRDVASGRKECYRNWRILENPVIPWSLNVEKHDWYHPERGLFAQKTSVELRNMFPEMRLKPKELNKVFRGVASSHKGWMLYDGGVESYLNSSEQACPDQKPL
jgi:hypothetical protein